jgi:VWFA-related protein
MPKVLAGWRSRTGTIIAAAFTVAAAVVTAGQSQPPATAPPQKPPSQAPPAQPPQAQPATDPQQPIRAGAELVRVDVTVVNNKGLPIESLTADDFEVLEDDVPQVIESFKFVSSTGRPEEGDETSLPIRSREHAAAEAARDDVRVFLIFWDEYHINRMASAVHAREYLYRFVRTAFGPKDLVAFMDPLTPVDAIRFTRERQELADHVRGLQGRLGIYSPARSVLEEAHMYSREGVERVRSQVTMTALKSAAVHLGSLRQGRKSIILISEGMRGLGRDEPAMLGDLIRTANDSNTAIYALNPLGLTMGYARGFDSLRALAANTGAESYSTNDFDRSLQKIVAQASAFYLLGYSPQKSPLDGRFHKIRVRVKKPGLDVRARTGYWAPTVADMERATRVANENKLPAAVATALSQLTPVTARRSVDFWVGTGLDAEGKPQVRMAWAPREADGEAPAVGVTKATAVGTSESGEAFSGEIARTGSTFTAPPGPLHVVLSAIDDRGEVVDRHERNVYVPDPAGIGMWISSPLVIRTSNAIELRAAKSDPNPPAAAERVFTRNDRLLIRFTLHGANATGSEITARLLNDKASPLTPLPIARKGNHCEIDLALTSIARGDFVIKIQARNGNESVDSHLPLRIVR